MLIGVLAIVGVVGVGKVAYDHIWNRKLAAQSAAQHAELLRALGGK